MYTLHDFKLLLAKHTLPRANSFRGISYKIKKEASRSQGDFFYRYKGKGIQLFMSFVTVPYTEQLLHLIVSLHQQKDFFQRMDIQLHFLYLHDVLRDSNIQLHLQ